MTQTNLAEWVLERYAEGQRYFSNLNLINESFDDRILEDVIFENCTLYVCFVRANLRNARFINGGVKTCDFRNADLTNAHFENVCVESVQFAGAKTEGVYFDNNSSYGQNVRQKDFDEWLKDYQDLKLPLT